MSDLMKILKERRSIRRYENKPVSDDALEAVLEAVQWSPSWANTQCWEIVVVKDPAQKERLQAAVPATNPASKAVVEAPVVLAVCGVLQRSGYYKGEVTTKFGDWFMFDLGIVTQSICLAARDQGLGTVITGLFDHAKAAEVLDVPKGCELVALIPLGYAAKESSAPKRREISEFMHDDRF